MATAFTFGPMALLALLLSGSVDLLSVLPTSDYWQGQQVEVTAAAMRAELDDAGPGADVDELIKRLGADDFQTRESATSALRSMGPSISSKLEAATGSPDLEVSERARAILHNLGPGRQAAATRRLMAIRTLGELQDRGSLPLLKRLTESERPFEADYARRALAAIEGRPSDLPAERLAAAAKLGADDVWMLPAGCGIVGRVRLSARPAGSGPDLDALMRQLMPTLPAADAERHLAQMRTQMVQAMHAVIDRIGNVRVDSLSFGLSEELSGRAGFVVFIVRGRFDRELVQSAVTEMRKGRGLGAVSRSINGIDVLTLDSELLLLPASDELAAIVAGATPRDKDHAIVSVATALASGKGAMGDNRQMRELVEKADRGGLAWAVMRNSPSFRSQPILSGVDTMVASLHVVGDAAKPTLQLAVTAATADATQATLLAGALQAWRTSSLAAMKEVEAAGMGDTTAARAALEAVKLASDGAVVRLTTSMTDPLSLPQALTKVQVLQWRKSEEEARRNGEEQDQ